MFAVVCDSIKVIILFFYVISGGFCIFVMHNLSLTRK